MARSTLPFSEEAEVRACVRGVYKNDIGKEFYFGYLQWSFKPHPVGVGLE